MKQAAIKRFFAASGFAICLAGFGGFAGVAAADQAPDTGTYDDMMDLAQETCWGGISLPSSVAWEVGNPDDEGCVHLRDTSDTSMTDIDEVGTWGMTDIAAAGSNPGHNAYFMATPQTVVP